MKILFSLKANWPAPDTIQALTTTRSQGFSQPPYDNNNLGLHVGDQEEAVLKNRQQLKHLLSLPGDPIWLSQTHSTTCVIVEEDSNRIADAAVTRSNLHPLAIMTADCLPITLCNEQGNEVAAIHAGWRGLAYGIIENTLACMRSNPEQIMAWIGPAICSRCFEVGDEVYEAFMKQYPFVANAFKKNQSKWLGDLPQLAELILNRLGVHKVYQSQACTRENEHTYYSYRRSSQTGRMATLIWIREARQNNVCFDRPDC